MLRKKDQNRLDLILLFALFLSISACGHQEKKTQGNHTARNKTFLFPQVPAVLQTPEERAAYVVSHYWVNFDFSDTTLIHNAEVTEQAFADYLNLFAHTSKDVVEKSISSMLAKAMAGSEKMFLSFAGLYEKYLYDPNSPFRNEEYYIIALQAIIANNQVDEQYKIRPRYQLEMAYKNRPGNIAADFEFTLKNGSVKKLSNVSASYTILFFNNPDCHDCARVKEILSQLADPRVRIVAIYPDEDIQLWKKAEYPSSWINGYATGINDGTQYELRAIPSLYLLDKEKRVLLKDAPVETVLDWLEQQN